MLLKANTQFWDVSLVVQAMHMKRTEAMEAGCSRRTGGARSHVWLDHVLLVGVACCMLCVLCHCGCALFFCSDAIQFLPISCATKREGFDGKQTRNDCVELRSRLT
jgi:hypothetical protein